MPDLRDRLRGLDRIAAPDVWGDIETRKPRATVGPEPSSTRRIGTAVVALLVAVAGIGLAVRALLPEGETSPSAADNGLVLVFGRGVGADTTQLFIVAPDGTSTPLTQATGPVLQAAWSADGTALAYAVDDGGSVDVYAVGADGTGDRIVCTDCAGAMYVGQSGQEPEPVIGDDVTALWVGPGGERVLVATVADGTIRIVDSATPDAPVVVERGEGVQDLDLAWSPDGSFLAFASQHPGSADVPSRPELDGIYVVRADGSGLIQVSRPPGPPYTHGADSGPSWSPAGDELAFARRTGTFEEGSPLQTGDHSEIWSVGVDGSAERRVTSSRGPAGATSPSWSPAGDRIAYLADRDVVANDSDLWVVGADGSDTRRLLACDLPSGSRERPCPAYGSLGWSPDGRSVTVDAYAGRSSAPYAIDVASGDLSALAPGLDEACCVRWQPLVGGQVPPPPTESPSPSESPHPTESPSTDVVGEIYEHPLGWTVLVPEGWYVVEFDGFDGRVTREGAAISNVPLEPTEDGMAPDLSNLFPDGAAVVVSHLEGGPAPDVTSDDSAFPIRMEDFEAIPGGLVVGATRSVRANGSDLVVELAVRADAPALVSETIGAIVGSLRPAPIEPGDRLPSGHLVVDGAPVAEIGSGLEVRVGGGRFMVIHAPGGFYAIDLPTEVSATTSFAWDSLAQEIVWTDAGEVFIRYDRSGTPVFSPEGVDPAILPIRPVARAGDGVHLLLHPDSSLGSLPKEMWPE